MGRLGTRSTKAGASTPATLGCQATSTLRIKRSTKAGASTPATLAGSPVCPARGADAQRRPGPRPRQHRRSRSRARSQPTLNEGRGLDPGNTSGSGPTSAPVSSAQRRPGPRPRQHARLTRPPCPSRRPLNEGRGLDPGNTTSTAPSADCSSGAQRRPGPRPRQHASPRAPSLGRLATAQRRPGPRPRQHIFHVHALGPDERRSTKAGASTPATHVGPSQGPVGPTRSTKAGASTPATHDWEPFIAGILHPTLNEGRGLDPGNTPIALLCLLQCAIAQRRPGPRPRQHMSRLGGLGRKPLSLNEGRGLDPGNTRPARPSGWSLRFALNEGRGLDPGNTRHRGLGRLPRGVRSTKAGASTPATRALHAAPLGGLPRSTKAGASTPATPESSRPPDRCS